MNKTLWKNASFWMRLLINIIDFVLFALPVSIIYYFLVGNFEHVMSLNYYLFILFSNLISFILFILIPIILNNKTIGMLICNVKTINQNNLSKWSKIKNVIKSSISSFGFFLLVSIIFLSTIYGNELNEFKKYINSSSDIKKNSPAKFVFTERFIVTITSIWFFISIINYAIIIVSKSKLGFYDFLNNRRIVYNKPFTQYEVNKKIKLVPIKVNNEDIIHHN
ncbi:RDD family protein [Mycoplasma sp. Mirounga ES2805-ORL]|uniref:RDD family protein n=1 Tax=Mycoplasma sp. Mirounga ES2805-ORL TaxID=754514 RepID=UPI00197B3E0A|nr:RDD family protein [Mycoplasma sp. Mirounga ES2805-ORL]QSF13873.1 RDD family protein [Mycoplasma sp. Mirounga ES2805-ORL]